MLKHTACVIDDGTAIMHYGYVPDVLDLSIWKFQFWQTITVDQQLRLRIDSRARQEANRNRQRHLAELQLDREQMPERYAKMREESQARLDRIRQQPNYGRKKRRLGHRIHKSVKRYYRRVNCEFRDRQHTLTAKEQLADLVADEPMPETTPYVPKHNDDLVTYFQEDGLDFVYTNGACCITPSDTSSDYFADHRMADAA